MKNPIKFIGYCLIFYFVFIGLLAIAAPDTLSNDTTITTVVAPPTFGDVSEPIIPATVGGIVAVIVILLGFCTYFFFNYQDSKLKYPNMVFNWGIWWKDNWGNFCLFTGFIIYSYLTGKIGKMNTESAFLIGLAPNKVIDWAGALIKKLSIGNQKFEARYK